MKTVLITGGSEGIGLELAKLYAEDGWRLLIAGRNKDKLEKAAQLLKKEYHAETVIFPCDLSETGAAESLYEEILRQGYEIDEAVNNAGVGYAGVSWQIPAEDDERLVVLNDISLMTLSKLIMRDMQKKGKGLIINIGSTGAFQPGPMIASYYASKSFAVSYSRAMNYEAEGTGVHVLAYCPGPVNTAFYEKSKGIMPPGAMSAQKCAEYLYRHRYTKKDVLIPGFVNNAASLIPSGLRMRIVAEIKKRLK
ncbi:MAG: SDR family NAD(P)-dependent oxidoreductase [Solobacterium sp.]|nr:SDR family NAD(P)-dependent oxidoreductase [Solobacterium sp.]